MDEQIERLIDGWYIDGWIYRNTDKQNTGNKTNKEIERQIKRQWINKQKNLTRYN